ncbi:MAG TPA: SHOCT domain-containing protein [Mucilaginibacter sp.]
MKAIFIICLLTIATVTVKAQQYILSEYQASNGITYHVKDVVSLGTGAAMDGSFLYLQMGGWAATINPNNPNANNIGRAYANTTVKVKKIEQIRRKGNVKTYFTVGGGNITNYTLYIEDAIQACEVTPCNTNGSQPVADKFDQLKKLKALLDSGALTQAEYDAQKKKLLAQ